MAMTIAEHKKKYKYCPECEEWVEGKRKNRYRCNQCGTVDTSLMASDAAHKFAKSIVDGTKLKKDGFAYGQRYDAAYWHSMFIMENLLDTFKRELEDATQTNPEAKEKA